MTVSITHPFISLKGDGGDATLVRPSNWNANHTTSMATSKILGRSTAGVGAFEELPTTAYMIAALNSADKAALVAALGVGVFDTGDVKFSIDPTAAAGWIAYNGEGTISKAGSGGTIRANADCLPLYIVIYVNIANAYCPVSGGRTGSDATAATNDFNAGKTIALPRFSGRTVVGAGTGSGLTARAAGAYSGAETHPLVVGEIPSITSVNPAQIINVSSIEGAIPSSMTSAGTINAGGTSYGVLGGAGGTVPPVLGDIHSTGSNNISVVSSGTSGTAHNNMQPHVAMWAKVKL